MLRLYPACTGPHLHNAHPLRLVAVAMEAQVWCIYLTVLSYLLRASQRQKHYKDELALCRCMYGSPKEIMHLHIQVVIPVTATPPCTIHDSAGCWGTGAYAICRGCA